ncbi:hypothetical protein EMCRGX_G017691 [Ephydatia muelleri]
MTAVEYYIFHCKSERCHFIPKSSNESQEIVYSDNVLRSNSGRLLVRKNGRLRYTARRNVGNSVLYCIMAEMLDSLIYLKHLG